jgi:hypothetical protein
MAVPERRSPRPDELSIFFGVRDGALGKAATFFRPKIDGA